MAGCHVLGLYQASGVRDPAAAPTGRMAAGGFSQAAVHEPTGAPRAAPCDRGVRQRGDIGAGRGRDVRVSRLLGAGHGRSGAGWYCARRKGNTNPPSCDSRKRSSLSSGRRGASSHGVPGRPSQAGGSAVFRSYSPGLGAHAASLAAQRRGVRASAADGRASWAPCGRATSAAWPASGGPVRAR